MTDLDRDDLESQTQWFANALFKQLLKQLDATLAICDPVFLHRPLGMDVKQSVLISDAQRRESPPELEDIGVSQRERVDQSQGLAFDA